MWDAVYGVWSLNHDITTSFGLAHTPIFQNWSPPLRGIFSIRVPLYALNMLA